MNETRDYSAEDLVAHLKDLPALPAVLADLILTLADGDTDSALIARKIQCDPALTSKTLRLANSPFFGLRGAIHTLKEAVTVLGIRSVRSLALASGISASLPIQKEANLDVRSFWQNALETAAAARVLSPKDEDSQNYALLGGLLHDIGKLALGMLRSDACAAVGESATRQGCNWAQAEAELGIPHHGLVGGALARRWNFPEALCRVITHHHGPIGAGGPVTAAVHIADVMSHAAGALRGSSERPPAVSVDAWQLLKPTPSVLIQAARAIRETPDVSTIIQ
ncbi:MAG: HDOD domain-containing protein [Betaproteobacteria bacterium]